MPDPDGPGDRAPSGGDRVPVWHPRRVRLLRGLFQLVGLTALLAFGAAVMPDAWIVRISRGLGFADFPSHPLTFYLVRHLSALYGLVGVILLALAADLERYAPLVRVVGYCTVALGLLQLLIGFWAQLPPWWSLGEGLSTLGGGLLILALDRWCRHP
jgi:hypothetical protein